MTSSWANKLDLALLPPPERIVLAVSGGADSVALLRAVVEARPESELVVAHLNHQLRGEESDEDARFVQVLCKSLPHPRLTCVIGRHDVAAEAERAKDNLESTARRVRYAWLTQVAREHEAPIIATGHTADDQAETVLHRLLRGSGFQGLSGIAPARNVTEDIRLVRPMLSITRQEILDYLQSLGQSFREDSSNAGDDFTRNRIRHQLLPLLEREHNPAVREVLTRLADQAREAHENLREQAHVLLTESEKPRAGEAVILDLARLRQCSPFQVRMLLRLIWEREGWPMAGMGFEQWKRLEAVVFTDLKAADFPGRIRARQRGAVLHLAPIGVLE